MEPRDPPVVTVAVRELVEFVWRTGGLGGEATFNAPGRALAGTRAHQRLQRSRPEGYRPEVFVSHDVPAGAFILRLRGRIDGIWSGAPAVIEEIKTTFGPVGQADPLHLAQAKIYAWIYVCMENLDSAGIQITYLDLETGQVEEFREIFSKADLESFFQRTISEYLEWATDLFEWRQRRDAALTGLPFPFPEYRAGQRRMAVAVYRCVKGKQRLFVEAPTGIGKTVSALYPALKALGEGAAEHIFYLTAKTPGRTVAEKALDDLRAQGAKVRCVTLTAKDKICFGEGGRCDRADCVFASGYYDKFKPALRELLDLECIDHAAVESVARRNEVCPFELSLDAALWCDVVIGDYNHAFDPTAHLKRFFDEPGAHVFLVDEAHNLVDRAREMFSADLDPVQILEVRKQLGKALPKLKRALSKLAKILNSLPAFGGATASDADAIAWGEIPSGLTGAVESVIDPATDWLARNEPSPFREILLTLLFRMMRFQKVAEEFDQRYRAICRPATGVMQLFCLDPSSLLGQALARGNSAVFFSATLSPDDYYRDVLGGSGETLRLPGPFPPDNLAVLIGTAAETTYRRREETLPAVAQCIAPLLNSGGGNTLVFFPSFKYMEMILEQLQNAHALPPVLVQKPGMSEEERRDFLAAFSEPGTVTGFAVLGGIFGEGIDLTGERLRQAVVVGVGLPQLCLERNLIREYYQTKNGLGYEYAYLFPGMNRVLQAAGRVIRTGTDRGLVLLLDRRFQETRYRDLFPSWWRTVAAPDAGAVKRRAQDFWNRPSVLGE